MRGEVGQRDRPAPDRQLDARWKVVLHRIAERHQPVSAMHANSVAVKTYVAEPISKIVSAAGGKGPAGPAVPSPIRAIIDPSGTA